MNAVKKICNFFGILLAWAVSLALVAVVTVTPITMTALSALQPSKASQMLSSIEVDQIDLSKYIPMEEEDQKTLAAIQELVTSDAAARVVELYMTDVYNAISGDAGELLLTADALVEIADEYMDELVQIAKNHDLHQGQSVQTIREEIRKTIKDEAENILAELPNPYEMVEEIKTEAPQVQTALQLIAQKDKIEMALITVIAVLALLLFLLRFPGFRGIRWLATALYFATFFIGLQALVVVGGVNFIEGILSLTPFKALAMPVISTLRNGMLIGTAVVLVAAILLTVAYCVLCKARNRKNIIA